MGTNIRGLLRGAVAAVLLAGCAPEANSVSRENGCPTSASAAWRVAEAGTFRIEASTSGQDCAHAIAMISVRDASGGTRWTEEYPVDQVLGLGGASSQQELEARLAQWIDQTDADYATTADLPEWSPEQDYPANGETAFHPGDGIDRVAYEAMRARASPVMCYVQGMESLVCLAWENGELQKIGLQTAPG